MQTVEFELKELPYEVNEELKLLRTNLQFCGTDKRVILMTSALSGEGKSTVTLDLARSLTELGKSVLLIDADMRKSVMRKKVKGHVPEHGLSHFLSGQCGADDNIVKTNVEKLFVIFSGSVPPNPTELLSTSHMDELIEIGKHNCDYVIVDCPPVGMVVDAAIVAPKCDGCMIMIESGKIKYRHAQEVVGKMRATGCPILGVILNKVDYKGSGKYYGRYYGKYYGQKYGGYYQ
jgi:capsular exopolysaccharide synthesis family protein